MRAPGRTHDPSGNAQPRLGPVVLIATPLEVELVARIAAVDDRLQVRHEPELLPPLRLACDHRGGESFRRAPGRCGTHYQPAPLGPGDGGRCRRLISRAGGVHAGPLAEFAILRSARPHQGRAAVARRQAGTTLGALPDGRPGRGHRAHRRARVGRCGGVQVGKGVGMRVIAVQPKRARRLARGRGPHLAVPRRRSAGGSRRRTHPAADRGNPRDDQRGSDRPDAFRRRPGRHRPRRRGQRVGTGPDAAAGPAGLSGMRMSGSWACSVRTCGVTWPGRSCSTRSSPSCSDRDRPEGTWRQSFATAERAPHGEQAQGEGRACL